MAQRIKKDDLVKIISGANKGTTGKVLAVMPTQNTALVEGVGKGTRHIKPSQLNPRGGKKDIHVATPLHKLALVTDEKTGKTTKVGYRLKDGKKVRINRRNGKEI